MAGFVVAALASLAASATPTPTPTPQPRVEEQVEKVLDEKEATQPPRFESTIEVVGQSPDAILERRLHGLDLECEPAGGGPPTEGDTRAVRPHPSPYADLVGLAKLVTKKAKGKGPDRYFLYIARRADGVSYIVREGRMPDAEFYNTTGASFELIEGFAGIDEARAALHRLEQGFDSPVSALSESRVPPWATANCRPKK